MPQYPKQKKGKGLIAREMQSAAALKEQQQFHQTLSHEDQPLRTGEYDTGFAVLRAGEALARQRDVMSGRDVAAGITARRPEYERKRKALRRGLRSSD